MGSRTQRETRSYRKDSSLQLSSGEHPILSQCALFGRGSMYESATVTTLMYQAQIRTHPEEKNNLGLTSPLSASKRWLTELVSNKGKDSSLLILKNIRDGYRLQ